MKKALLIVNLGTPDDPGYFSVFKYLREFLSDEKVLNINPILRFILVNFIICPTRSFSSSKIYKKVWDKDNGSPLLHNTKLLAQKLDKKLPDVDVQYAMRYQSPSIKMTLNKMLLKNPDEIVILPLFPHYAAATTGSVFKEVTSYLSDKWVVPKITFINQFYDNTKFIEAWLEKAREFDMNSYDKIIFSYHGVPNSHVDNVYPDSMCSDNNCETKITNDNKFCYKATVYETTKILASKLELEPNQYIVTFQSRLTNKWLSPFTDDVLQNLPKNGSKKVLVFSPAFTADCLETIIEIGDEYKELFYEAGGDTLDYVPSLNYSDKWVDAIVDISNINEGKDVQE
jgi:ferrochelatase